MSRTRLAALCLLALLLLTFVGAVLPASYSAADQSAALYAYEHDAPTTVLPPLLDVYAGQIPPRFSVYGHFPAYLTALLSLPVLGPIKLVSGSIDYVDFVRAMRWTQIVMAVLTLVYVYRIGVLVMPPLAAVAAAILVATMAEFYSWTLGLHPDIFQAAMLVMAVFYLTRAQESGSRRDLWLSAVLAGFATASKYYGVFIFPAVALSLLSGKVVGFRLAPGAVREVFVRGLVYGLIVVAVFSLINARLFFSAAELRGHLEMVGGLAAAPGQRLDLLGAKLANLVSPKLLGISIVAVYVAAWAWLFARDCRRWIQGSLVFHPLQVIHATCWAFGLYYFGLFADVFNLYRGERYLLPFLCLVPIPAVHLLSAMVTVRAPAVRCPLLVRSVGVVLIALLALLEVKRVSGEPLEVYRPTPRLIHRSVFELVVLYAVSPDREVLEASYEPSSTPALVELKRGLSCEQRRGLRDYWRERSWLLAGSTPWEVIDQHLGRRQWLGLRARQWIIDNVRPGAVIYTQHGMGLLPTNLGHVLYADNTDLPTKDIHQDTRIDPAKVPLLKPDYILTDNAATADAILAQNGRYQTAAVLRSGNAIFILQRN